MKIMKHLKKFDGYGKPVSVNFKGEDVYRTKMGGVFTILFVGTMMTYSANLLVNVINKKYHDDTFNEVHHNLTLLGNMTGENLNFQVGYAFVDRETLVGTNDIFDETYFKININLLSADDEPTP